MGRVLRTCAMVALTVSGVTSAGRASARTPLACGSTFSVVPSPNPLWRPGWGSIVTGLGAVAPDDLWAVGNVALGPSDPFSEHWDGLSWTVVPMAGIFAGNINLTGVAAVSTRDVWAVGSINTSGFGSYVEHWDGTAWSVVPTPSIAGYESFLNGVSGVSANEVWAVGGAFGADTQTLALHWAGTSWSVVPTPSPATNNVLNSVDALAANDAWAVGGLGQGRSQTLVEHWDGASWSVVPSPNVGVFSNVLRSVKAVSTGDIWAVGQYEATLGGDHLVLVLHWDGAVWSVVPAPSVSQADNDLTAVAAACADDVYSIGWARATGSESVFVEHWDGSTWCIAPGAGDEPACATAIGDAVWVGGSAGGGTLMARATAGPTGTVGDGLLAFKRASDVALDWSAGALVPRRYNVHREAAKDAISPPASPPIGSVASSETYVDPGAIPALPALDFYQVYGRDCAGNSIFD